VTARIERLEKGELDHEALWLLVIAATGIVGIAWLLSPRPTPTCNFHRLTGLPCPTCGGTRCVRALLAGDLRTAFGWNPLVAIGTFAAAAYAIYAFAVVTFRLPRIRLKTSSRAEANAVRILVAVAVAANWIYLIFRFSKGT